MACSASSLTLTLATVDIVIPTKDFFFSGFLQKYVATALSIIIVAILIIVTK